MFAVFGLGMLEALVLLAVGLLLFGRRLPGVARRLGPTLVGFKKKRAGRGMPRTAPEATPARR